MSDYTTPNAPKYHHPSYTTSGNAFTPNFQRNWSNVRFNNSNSPLTSRPQNTLSPRATSCRCRCTCGVSGGHTPQSLTSTPSRKRGMHSDNDKENNGPASTNCSDSQPPKKKSKRTRNICEKIYDIFQVISAANLSLSEFLYLVFSAELEGSAYKVDDQKEPWWRDGDGIRPVSQNWLGVTAQVFLSGSSPRGLTKHPAGEIIKLWLNSKYGRLDRDSPDMYSPTTPYHQIRPIRACLSSFAVQLVAKKLVREAEEIVKPSSGLHAVVVHDPKKPNQKAEWVDIGATTVSSVLATLRERQPVAFYLLSKIAGRKLRVRQGELQIRERRPVETVVTHALSSLDFARNSRARLLPLAKGVLYFAHSAPADLFAYESRIGNMPSYNSVYKTMRGLAQQLALETRQIGRDPTKTGVIRADNVQQHTRVRDPRIGRENAMHTGIGATFFEIEGFDPKALDLDDQLRRIAENKRNDLTVDQLVGWIDEEHIEKVFILWWLKVLCDTVPQLARHKPWVTELFRTRAAKRRLPVKPTKARPLATSSKNETITTDLKDGVLDFLEQVGQTESDFIRRPNLIAGDGLTYEKIHTLKKYLRFHTSDFQSFRILTPILDGWHTEETNLTRLVQCHWGRPLSTDPSTLGHSARKIGHKEPNLKKVDYYPTTHLAYLVCDARMLDCWRLAFRQDDLFEYFDVLEQQDKIPTFEELEVIAKKLHRGYTSTRAQYRAMHDSEGDNEWSKIIPTADEWFPPAPEPSSADVGIRSQRPKGTNASEKSQHSELSAGEKLARNIVFTPDELSKKEQAADGFKGDRVLARSMALIREITLSRECAYAAADGDVGRVYEVLKVILFLFAGSSHTKYTSYLLEFICHLELESNTGLRNLTLDGMLVNLCGMAGRFDYGDHVQEYFNRILEAVIERKGAEFGDKFIREVISRNLHHMARIKKDLREGVGLKKRAGKHSEPHTNPELRTLLKVYKEVELGSRRKGREMDDDKFDHFPGGYENFRAPKGRLQKFKGESIRARQTGENSTPIQADADEDDDEDDAEEEALENPRPTLGSTRVNGDGDLIFEDPEFDETVNMYCDMLDREAEAEEISSGNDTEDVEPDCSESSGSES